MNPPHPTFAIAVALEGHAIGSCLYENRAGSFSFSGILWRCGAYIPSVHANGQEEEVADRMAEAVLSMIDRLPHQIAQALRRYTALDSVEEIRIRRNKRVCVTVCGKNHPLDAYCTEEMFRTILQELCAHSLYSHAETIRDGYISVDGGIRVGVCGRAVLCDGKLTGLREIASLCIRLPHRVYGIAAPLYEKMREGGFHDNVLVYSLPGHGKTTLLRELIPLLASGENALRIAVIDTRYELYGKTEDDMADVLYGYPRALGMETAIRTLSPQMILCDELMTAEDLAALENCVRCGIPFCATMHAASPSGIDPTFRRYFSLFCAVTRIADGEHRYTYQSKEEAEQRCTI